VRISLPPIIPIRDHLPTRTVSFVNYMLIAANVAAYLWMASLIANGADPEALARVLGVVPAHFLSDPVGALPSVLTSMFVHGGLGHIAGNMLFLWIFGDNVEEALGHFRYLVFYLLGGLCAATAQSLAALGDPTALLVPMIGASGAISAVLAAYALLYPLSPITVLVVIFPFSFPAWLVISSFFVTNLIDAFANATEGGVAFMAHVGGFLGGMFFLRWFMAGRVRMDEYARWQRWESWRRQRERDVF
jgi:membrane associated rhomboid family serine protease